MLRTSRVAPRYGESKAYEQFAVVVEAALLVRQAICILFMKDEPQKLTKPDAELWLRVVADVPLAWPALLTRIEEALADVALPEGAPAPRGLVALRSEAGLPGCCHPGVPGGALLLALLPAGGLA
ncbi:hypothetical protein WJX81_005856 [Elliptochloris bilobata]|uniref:Uncharacterized protein n=1 Tax=Elliptochloris bilobata TaxID=381761 RepID=A0AAW1QJ57_9CHLO